MLYHMMARMINIVIDAIPGGNLVAAPVKYALYYWDRMSEFTADRAGLLSCQKPTAAIKAFVKMAGLPKSEYSNININTFLEQAQEFNNLDYDGLNYIVKILSIAEANHPWTVMRAAQLVEWIRAG
jgi:Zn-dependent protease with chaperone function